MNANQRTEAVKDWRIRLGHYWRLVRADRPIGIYLLLWPALWALWVAAEGIPPWWTLLVFVLGTALMRSAGCAINDYADRDFDGQVSRTAQRPLATGLVSPREAVAVFVVLSLLAFALVLTLNTKTIAYSFVAVALAASYPFMKRYTHMPQLVLGMAFGWAVPMAFTALQNQTPPVAWVLFAATVVWALIYDTMYAMVDRDDDLKIGIKSTAILFGRFDRLVIGLLQVLMLALLVAGRARWPGAACRLSGRAGGRCGPVRLPSVADPRARTAGLFPRISAQSLFRHAGVPRPVRRLPARSRLMIILRWMFWPVLLLPAVWWSWQALHAPPAGRQLANGAHLEWVDCWFDKPLWRPMHCAHFHTAPEAGATPEQFVLPVVYIPQ